MCCGVVPILSHLSHGTVGSHRILMADLDITLNFTCIPFHSLEENEIGDLGATALADVLTVNQSLKTLRYIWHLERNL